MFQVHGIGARGTVLARRQLRRAEVLGFFTKLPPCLVGMEACATGHHWAREIAKLGHEVRLIPPAHVKPHVMVNRQMSKSQQVRWSRRGAGLLLQVRCAVCNGTLGSGFGQKFQPANDPCPTMATAA